jgi:Holliday junction resolvase RusA-like endonuclease
MPNNSDNVLVKSKVGKSKPTNTPKTQKLGGQRAPKAPLGIDATCPLQTPALAGLKMAQFFFAVNPLSTNQLWATAKGRIYLSAKGREFKNAIKASAVVQARAMGWECKPNKFGFWVIARAGHVRCESVDISNVQKAIEDAFVSAGLIPDDSHARDTRQIYGHFEKLDIPADVTLAVLIRWGNPINQGGSNG